MGCAVGTGVAIPPFDKDYLRIDLRLGIHLDEHSNLFSPSSLGLQAVPDFSLMVPLTSFEESSILITLIVPWWLMVFVFSPLTPCSPPLVYSMAVRRTTSQKGTSWHMINQMSIILIAEVGGSPSILLMKIVVMTSIVVKFTVRAASKKYGLKKVVAKVIAVSIIEGKYVVIISLVIFRLRTMNIRTPS